MERAARVDDRPVLAAEGGDVAVALGRGLAVDPGAVGGLGDDGAGGVALLDGVPLVLGAVGDEPVAVRQRDGDAVVRGRGVEAGELVLGQLPVLEGLEVEGGDGAGAVGEESGAAGVGDDVAGVLGGDDAPGEVRGDLVVVVVVPVRLDDESEVEDLEAVGGGDEDVAAVAGRVEAEEALLLDVGEDLAGGRVEDLDAAVVGDGGAGLEVRDLDLLVLGG